MNKKIKQLIVIFQGICSMSETDVKQLEIKRAQLESWFKTVERVGLKSEVGLYTSSDHFTNAENGIKSYHFSYIDAFDGVNISILGRFGGKDSLFELSSIVHLPEGFQE